MGRRRYTRRMQCEDPGCSEIRLAEFSTRREERDDYQQCKTWLCIRHRAPHKVLCLTNRKRVTEIEALPSKSYPNLDGLFWRGDCMSSRFVSGVGWQAHANDFPKGTRIHVTVEVLEGE